MISRRSFVLAAVIFLSFFAISRISDLIRKATPSLGHSTALGNAQAQGTSPSSTGKLNGSAPVADNAASPLSPQVLKYFDQVFSVEKPSSYDFPALRQQCVHTKWPEDSVYLKCVGIAAGLTSIMSQVKVCLKMALEAGTGIILPSMPLRDSTNLKEFNFLNGEAYMTYDNWFDADHLIEQIGRACPQMKILHPDQLDTINVPVKNRWNVDVAAAPGYQSFTSYFWVGRTFKAFFEQQFTRLEELAFLDPSRNDSRKGITVIEIHSQFLMFRITDDPTGQDLRLWNDLSYLIRFKEEPRRIVDQLLSLMGRPFYGVHFRVESDTIWSSLENQLSVDLDALESVWIKYGTPGSQKPLVYLACGDQQQLEKFVLAGTAKGWEITHKWQLAQSNRDTLQMINDLAFDFQGAVDMGIMIKSNFFLGIIGSAFSSTIGNARDLTGRYRGSSLTVYDDESARTHLFNDGDASAYACCL